MSEGKICPKCGCKFTAPKRTPLFYPELCEYCRHEELEFDIELDVKLERLRGTPGYELGYAEGYEAALTEIKGEGKSN